MSKRILMTGAAGGVAGYLRTELAGRYEFHLTDRHAMQDLRPEEHFQQADVTDFDAMRAQMEGMDGVIHLGSLPVEDAWEGIFDINIGGTYNVIEAARQAGVERFIFASSNHAIGFYPRSQRISDDDRVRPDSRYGVSKAFGEALGSLYADKYGLRVLSIRIGNVAPAPVDRRRLSIWISPRDLAQMVSIGLDHPELRNEVFFGMSDNERGWWDNSAAHRFGYEPQDKSEDYAAELLARAPTFNANSIPEQHQGGDFCVVESGGGAPNQREATREEPK